MRPRALSMPRAVCTVRRIRTIRQCRSRRRGRSMTTARVRIAGRQAVQGHRARLSISLGEDGAIGNGLTQHAAKSRSVCIRALLRLAVPHRATPPSTHGVPSLAPFQTACDRSWQATERDRSRTQRARCAPPKGDIALERPHLGETTIAARRFCARPAGVRLSPTGSFFPFATTAIRFPSSPTSASSIATTSARRRDNSRS